MEEDEVHELARRRRQEQEHVKMKELQKKLKAKEQKRSVLLEKRKEEIEQRRMKVDERKVALAMRIKEREDNKRREEWERVMFSPEQKNKQQKVYSLLTGKLLSPCREQNGTLRMMNNTSNGNLTKARSTGKLT